MDENRLIDEETRDPKEEDPDGRMTDLLPPPGEDFDDEAIATETEDDYSDESDAEIEESLSEQVVRDLGGVGTVYGAGGHRPD